MSLLNLKGVKSEVEGKEILKGVDLTINKGEVHVIMGPNGAGKSTLASVLVGHPKHEISEGEIVLEGEEVIHYSLVDSLSEDKEEKKPDFFILKQPHLTQDIHLTAGDFAVFLPGEAHQALCMVNLPDKVKKAVFKIPTQILE